MVFRSCRYSVRFLLVLFLFFLWLFRRCCRSPFCWATVQTLAFQYLHPFSSSSLFHIILSCSVLFQRKLSFFLVFWYFNAVCSHISYLMFICWFAFTRWSIACINDYNSIGGNDPLTKTQQHTVHLILFRWNRTEKTKEEWKKKQSSAWKCMTKIVEACDFDIWERSRIENHLMWIGNAVWK